MLTSDQFQAHASSILSPEKTAEAKVALVQEIRDSIETVHTAEYGNFLQAFVSTLCTVLQTGPVQQMESPDQKLRNMCLEILSRLPHNDVLRPYVPDIVATSLSVLQSDNEENGLVALRILVDLLKSYRPSLDEHVPPFLDFVKTVYHNFPETYQYFFEVLPGQLGDRAYKVDFTPSTRSFKVAAECPWQVMFLLNIYPRVTQPYLLHALPLMVNAVTFPGPTADALPAGLAQVHQDFKQAQVKIVSFLAYLLRNVQNALRQHQQVIIDSLVRILETCPDSLTLRRELLIAIRQALTSPSRNAFYPKLDVLLDEDTLIGRSSLCQETLRPLAFSMLAELIHHIRQDLTLPQLARIIYIFSRNMHDPFLPISVKATSVRLMLNLVEVIFSRRGDQREAANYRALLLKIMHCYTSKMVAINAQVDKLLKISNEQKAAAESSPEAAAKENAVGEPADKKGVFSTIFYLQQPTEQEKMVTETKALVHQLFISMKTLLYSIVNFGNARTMGRPLAGTVVSQLCLREDELRVLRHFLTHAIGCLRLFSGDSLEEYGHYADTFAVLLDPKDTMELWYPNLDFFFSEVVKEPKLMRVITHLMESGTVSLQFSEVLVSYIIPDKLAVLQDPGTKEAELLLEVLSSLFAAIDKNGNLEPVLLPVFNKLISESLKLIATAREPRGYVKLFQSLFRVVSTGKYERIYAAFAASGLLQLLLSTLKEVLAGPHVMQIRETLVELCLTMPVRLQDMLTAVPQLMDTIVVALKGTDDLVSLGLRTLEYWVDSLNPEFLEPAMADVKNELMQLLWNKLRPAPYQFGAKTLQLLGKLGGSNRRFLHGPMEMEYKQNHEHGLRLILTFDPSTSFLVPLDRCIALARGAVHKPKAGAADNVFYREQALQFLHICLSSVLNLRPPEESQMPGDTLDKFKEMLFGDQAPPHLEPVSQTMDVMGAKTKAMLMAEKQVFRTLMATALAATGESEIWHVAKPFADGICRHFGLLFAAGVTTPHTVPPVAAALHQHTPATRHALKVTLLRELDAHIFLDSIVDVLCDENESLLAGGLDALSLFLDTLMLTHSAQQHLCPDRLKKATELSGSSGSAEGPGSTAVRVLKIQQEMLKKKPASYLNYPLVLDELLPRLLHCCYGDTWPCRMGGVQAIQLVIRKLPQAYMRYWMPHVVHALLLLYGSLPDHSNKEKAEVKTTVIDFLLTYFPPPANDAANGVDGDEGVKVNEADGDKTDQPTADPAAAAAGGGCGVDVPMESAATGGNQSGVEAKTEGAKDATEASPVDGNKPDGGSTPSGAAPTVGPPPSSPSTAKLPNSSLLDRLLALITRVLFNSKNCGSIRDAADACLQIIASSVNQTVPQLLKPFLDQIKPPIEHRRLVPIRKLATTMGNAAAITYAMQLNPPLVTLSQEILMTTSDAFVILTKADAELMSSMSRNTSVQSVQKLKVACLELLCAALKWQEFRESTTLQQLRTDIIQHLFKLLTAPDEPLVKVARQGLMSIISHGKIHKNQLQAGLRPLLAHLPFFQRMTLNLLSGLSILLELLANWFNVTLGEKVIEHLRNWLDPERLNVERAWETGQEAQVAAAMLNLFHMLPSQAQKFLETQDSRMGLVVLTIELENVLGVMSGVNLPSKLWSPYREPLINFLNKYSNAAIKYFLDPTNTRLSNPDYFNRLLDIIRSPQGAPLLDELCRSTTMLATILQAPQEQGGSARFQCLHLLSVVVRLRPDWLEEPLYRVLLDQWRSPQRKERLAMESDLPRNQQMESKYLADCLLNYIQRHHEEVAPLFDLLSIFGHKLAVNYVFIRDFYSDVVAETYTEEEKQKVLRYFLSSFKMSTLSQEQIVYGIRFLMIPMLSRACDKNETVVDEQSLGSIVKDMLDPTEEVAAAYTDQLKMELHDWATLLVRKFPQELTQYRTQLIKFGWNNLRKDDSACRYNAFVYMAYFFDAFRVPEKIVLQVFLALLRTVQPDSRRALVRQALDVLVPSLAKRCQSADNPRSLPMWIRYIRRMLVEESHSLQHLVHIWQLLIRHPVCFYPWRSQFTSQIINWLTRLGMPANQSVDNRRLSVDMAGLILRWEQMRREYVAMGANATPDPADTASQGTRKRSREDAVGDSIGSPDEPSMKLMKAEDQTTISTGHLDGNPSLSTHTTEQAVDTHEKSSGQTNSHATSIGMDHEFKPTPAMEEMVVNFLVRMLFLLADAKDKELKVMEKPTLAMVEEALRMCPNARVKISYMEKLLGQAQQQQQATQTGSLTITMLTGLEVLNLLMSYQPTTLVPSSYMIINSMLEPCFVSTNQQIVQLLGSMLKKLFATYPLRASADGVVCAEAQHIQTRLHEHIVKHLTLSADPAILPVGDTLLGLCCSINVLQQLQEVAADYVYKFTAHLVKLLSRIVREHSTSGGNLVLAPTAEDRAALATNKGPPPPPAYGTLRWVVHVSLELAAARALSVPDNKKVFLQTLVALITGNAARHMDPVILLDVLSIIQKWVVDPNPVGGGLTAKEAILFLQRLAQVGQVTHMEPATKETWNKIYLELLYKLCTEELGPQGPGFRKEVFERVEREFLLGMRADDPTIRNKFFKLYNGAIPKKLFERLKFVVHDQNWESVASQFWLKNGLDLIFAVLRGDDAIILAPNSASVPCLLAKTPSHMHADQLQFHMHQSSARPPRHPDSKGSMPPPAPKTEVAEEPQTIKQEDSTKDSGIKQEPEQETKAEAASEAPPPGGDPMDFSLPGIDTDLLDDLDIKLPDLKSEGEPMIQVPNVGESMPLEVPPQMIAIFEEHAKFLTSAGQYKVHQLVCGLGELAANDSYVAYHLWVLVFPIVWATLVKEQQIALAKPIIALFSREFHVRQAGSRPNVIQALLEGISLSQPQPKIPSELIKFLGKTYNAWNIAIPLLESHVMLFPLEMRCFCALCELYQCLNEEDILAGLWKRRGKTEDTKCGLALMQQGLLERAQDVFLAAITKGIKGEQTHRDLHKGEMAVWQQEYIQCCFELGHWSDVAEYANNMENYSLVMDSLAKMMEWGPLKEQVLPKAQVEDGPHALIIHTYVHLVDGNFTEAEKKIHMGLQEALKRWWQMPEVGFQSQLPLLYEFQQLVELMESSRVLLDVNNNLMMPPTDMGNQYGELKDTMETWRVRTPNEWESVTQWSDILVWRNHVYDTIITQFAQNPNLQQLGYRDKAWSVNRLGRAARYHGFYNTCITITNTMYGYPAMEVQEAFIKVTEQAKAFLSLPSDIMTGLNLLNGTNLDYFQPQHQAEIYRLKGNFLEKLEDMDGANLAYSCALTLFSQMPEGWSSWGSFCDTMYEASGSVEWLEQAVACYLTAVKQGSPEGRSLLPRLLTLLSSDTTNTVGPLLVDPKHEGSIPLWMWLCWIPQLLMGLQRPEAGYVKPLLMQVANQYPQALYYSLRTYLLSLKATQDHRAKDAAAKKAETPTVVEGAAAEDPQDTGAAGMPQESPAVEAAEKPQEQSAFEMSKDVMDALRSKHGGIASLLEVVLTEIGGRFVPKPEERLLAVVHALLHRCYKLPLANTAEVPASLKKELSGVCKACFSSDSANRHGRMMNEFRDQFVADLTPDSPAFPTTLGELAERLKSWKNALQSTVEDIFPPVLRLEDEGLVLTEQSLVGIEMPGQYWQGTDITSESVVYLERIGCDVHIVRRHGTSSRRLTFYASDGHHKCFMLQTGQNAPADERVMQLLRMLNRLLDDHPETRRRYLQWHTPLILPVWPQVRLVEEEPSYSTYGEAYEVYCARSGREPDLPIVQFKKRVAASNGQILPDPTGEIRLQAYLDIERNFVTENVFSQFMYKTLPTCNQLCMFKKQLCTQLALTGLQSYLLLISGRSPNKILFAKNSGKTWLTEIYPVYNQQGNLERTEVVPFRLTRNLITFFTPFGVEGVFIAAMCAAAQALSHKQKDTCNYLSMFFRDDVLSWQSRRSSRGSGVDPSQVSIELLKSTVKNNVSKCMDRVDQVAPPAASSSGSQMPLESVQAGAHRLVDAASNPKNLCRLDPTWHPWF